MDIKKIKQISIFLVFIILTISNSLFMIQRGINSYIEIVGFLLLIIVIWFFFIKETNKDMWRKTLLKFIVILFIFCIGIILQQMNMTIKIRLIFSMFVISSITIISGKFMNSLRNIRSASYGIFIGTIIATFLSIIGDISLRETVHEGLLDIGFNGGLQYKNYYAAAILASFIGIYVSNKYEKTTKNDIFVLGVEIILIFLSSSRGGYLLLIAALILLNIDKLNLLYKRIFINDKNKKMIFNTLICILLISGLIFITLIISNSNNYMYRVRGVINYMTFHKNDWFHLLFGNSKMAFGNPDIPYVLAIRQGIDGFNGSYEMGFINVVIKNGFIGLIGYIYIFAGVIIHKNNGHKKDAIAILIVLLISSLVESYVCNIHAIFGIYCYLFVFGILSVNKKN